MKSDDPDYIEGWSKQRHRIPWKRILSSWWFASLAWIVVGIEIGWMIWGKHL